MNYLLLIAGFAALIKGADWLVDGAVNVAKRAGLSEMLIGLTIVSMGTSMPELMISVVSSLDGRSEMAIGNVLGSNIANILLILGATALIRDLPVRQNIAISEVPFSLAAALLIGFLANTQIGLEAQTGLDLSRMDGIIILFFFFLFMAYVVMTARKDRKLAIPVDTDSAESLTKPLLMIVAGMAGLFLGGKWVVDSAVALALKWGMSETLVGLTIVALGTSLPELVTSLSAAWKRNTDIAVGNAVGSNIFNLLWILGVSSLLHPIPFNVASNADILAVIGSTSMILVAMVVGGRFTIKRLEGLFFLIVYGLYLYYVIQRG